MIKLFLIKPLVMFYKIYLQLFNLFRISSNRVGLSWNYGDKLTLSLKPQTKIKAYHVVLTIPENSPGKVSLTIGE